MARATNNFDVYLEIGKKRTVASVIDWPGWCRSARDEESVLQALFDYAPRYAKVLKAAKVSFTPPDEIAAFNVVERLEGNASTDFGICDLPTSSDKQPIDDAELKHLHKILHACWKALDKAAAAAEGKELRKGPRGGGRELEGVVEHVMGGEQGYLSRLGRKHVKQEGHDLAEELAQTHQEALDALDAAARGDVPESGPRGGKIWLPRYFVRRVAWHVLDHVWEIEDRVM